MHIGQISSDTFSCNTLEFEHEAISLSRKECMEFFFITRRITNGEREGFLIYYKKKHWLINAT